MPRQDDDNITPIRKQYLDIKKQHPNAIVLFRLGDFYETFDSDAETAAQVLDIVLTGRNVAKGMRVPMAGIPYHAAENYIARLLDAGYHVAIAEQVGEQPERGLMQREVIRVVTPGTLVEPGLLNATRHNYLGAVIVEGTRAGLAYVEISTGQFAATQLEAQRDVRGLVRQELARLACAEVLTPGEVDGLLPEGTHITALNPWKFETGQTRQRLEQHFGVTTLEGFGLTGKPLAMRAAGAILHYLNETQPAALGLLTGLQVYSTSGFMQLDPATRRNLELTETLRDRQIRGSLLGVLNYTVTPMGGRLLREWLHQPLLVVDEINARLDGVSAFYDEAMLRAELLLALKPLGDLERLLNRVRGGIAVPRDVGMLRAGLQRLPGVKRLLKDCGDATLAGSAGEIDTADDIRAALESALNDDEALPGTLEKPDFIREGWSAELDGIRQASAGARAWINTLEGRERARTGIKTLKVGFNKVFGYYIELTRSVSEQAPDDYIRKQTLVNAERYITPELKEYETLVLNAETQMLEVEIRLFRALCEQISGQAERLLHTARVLARLDVLAALAEAAARQNFVRPQVVADDVLDIREGRHPVVEDRLPPGTRFMPNDIVFGNGERVRIITGPNMSGKSTYLRQAALVVLMAQVGSFVPAHRATIGMVDRIFTRIGAQDEIHAGQSTFMVEMVETANILHHATPRSLLILDEIGRGTSTYDGLSLAWAIVEYVHNHPQLRAKTLFATHYHELTDLANRLPGVENYNVAVTEEGDSVVFLHKIVPGGADRSYGIHVAQLAGLPKPVINRANEILRSLEASGAQPLNPPAPSAASDIPQQLALFPETSPLVAELRALDVNGLTPIEALNVLYGWKKKFTE